MKTSDIKQDFNIGDVVAFDVEGANPKPFGYGKITFISNNGWRMTPDAPIPGNLKIVNVRKAGNAGK